MEVGAHLWGQVLVLWVEVLGLVLEVMQGLQRVLQGLVLKLVVVVVVIMVVLTHQMLVHVVRKLLGLVFEELLKLLRGLFVCDEPVLWREAKPVRGGGWWVCAQVLNKSRLKVTSPVSGQS